MSAERAQQLIEAGIWLRLSGDGDGAKRLFEQALRLDPGNAKATELLRGPGEAAAPLAPVKPSTESQFGNPFSRPAEAPINPNAMEADWGMATGYQSGIYRSEAMPPLPAAPKVSAAQVVVPPVAPVRGSATNVVLSGTGFSAPEPRGTPPIFGSGEDDAAVDIAVDDDVSDAPLPFKTTSSRRIPAPGSPPPVSDSSGFPARSMDSGPRSSNTMVFGSPVPQATMAQLEPDEHVEVDYGGDEGEDVSVDVDVDVDEGAGSQAPMAALPVRSRASAILSQLSVDLDMAADEIRTQGPPTTKSSVPFRWPTPEPFPVAPPSDGPAPAASAPASPAAPSPQPASPLPAQAASAWETRADPGIDLPSQGAVSGPLDLLSSDSRIQPASSPSEPGSNVEKLLGAAKDLIALDDHTGAMELIVKAQAIRPDDPVAAQLRERSEATLLTMYESKLGKREGVPRVLLKDDEIIWLNLDHRAGFMLAQIDGGVCFEDLFAVSGMSRFDTARILAQLVDEGVISRG